MQEQRFAPNAGRISGSSILLGGETIPLTPNEGANQLHGGPHNLRSELEHRIRPPGL